MDEVVIEPVGGFTGGATAVLKSEGRMSMAALSAEDRAAVVALMAAPEPHPGNFGYRLTLHTAEGTTTRQVGHDQVPAALVASIQTAFR